jgi:hypothetical protein
LTGLPTTLPLIDRTVLRPFLELLNDLGAPSEKLLAQAHLPRLADAAGGQSVSARSLLQFLSIAARETDIQSLGWRIATESEITFVRLGLSFERGRAWLWHRVVDGVRLERSLFIRSFKR